MIHQNMYGEMNRGENLILKTEGGGMGMKRKILLDTCLVSGEEKRELELTFSKDVIEFSQRKKFDEYTWESKDPVALTLEIIDKMSEDFQGVSIDLMGLTINV